MRRNLLVAGAAVVLLGLAIVGVFTLNDDEGDEGRGAGTTTNSGPAVNPTPRESGSTTTAKGAPVQSGGAAPVSGAILSRTVDEPGEPVDVGEETDCSELDPSLEPVACTRARGSGGQFLVFVGRTDAGGLQAGLYRGTSPSGYEFRLVRRSDTFEPGGDVVGMTLTEGEANGEPLVIVDYDFDGSGAVHSFDVVAWDSSDVDPRVVAFVNGTGGDRAVRSGSELQFVGGNYDDGAPTCCPNFADVRTLEHSGPGEWKITEKTVPFAEAP